jgi:hypothetical protein
MDPISINPDLAAALAAAQGEIQNPPKNREVTVQTRDGGRPYTFAYATLDAILDQIRPIMSRHGLCLIQIPAIATDGAGNAVPVLRSIIAHKCGATIHADVPLAQERPGNQGMGSALTYARRYGLLGLLAIAAEEDDDANSADGNTVQASRDRRASPPHQAAPLADGRQLAPPVETKVAAKPPSIKADWDHACQRLAVLIGAEDAALKVAQIKAKAGTDYAGALAILRAEVLANEGAKP